MWVVEGVFIYFPDEVNARILATIEALSAPGSVLTGVHFGPASREEEGTKALNSVVTEQGYGFKSWISSPHDWLGARGWDVSQKSIAAHSHEIDRAVPYEETPGNEVSWMWTAHYGGAASD